MGKGNNFDALRIVGAGMVLVSHQFAVMGLGEPIFGGITLGKLGVMLFFAISGYLIAQSWQSDANLWRFAVRRTLRIAPALLLVHVLTIAMLKVLGIVTFDMNPLPAVNGSLWTIPLEVECYLIFALLALAAKRAGLLMIGLFVIGWASGLFFHLPWVSGQLATFGAAFGLGALLQEKPVLRRPFAMLGMAAAGVVIWAASVPSFGIAMAAAAVAIYAGERSWPVMRDAGRFGDMSYGVYLYAFPVQQLFVLWLGPQQPYLVMLLLTAIVVVFLAWLSWRWVEAPALRLKRFLRPDQAVSYSGTPQSAE